MQFGPIRAVACVLVAVALPLAGCASPAAEPDREPRVVRVPQDAPTAQDGADLLEPGDLLLLDAGVYRESLVISTPEVTVRGADRNRTEFDGEGSRSTGITVIADGVRVQNLTVHSYLYNGVLITGLHDGSSATAHGVGGYDRLDPERFPPIQRFAIESVTAYDNGLYGLYAFDAQHGVIADSYASGSSNAGIYVGQCEACDIVVTGNVAEGNALGFENANASGPMTIAGNRVGMTLTTNYQEAYVPQRENHVAGNLIADNRNPDTRAHAEGAFGIGVGIGGGTGNVLRANRIAGHPNAGVVLSNGEDIAAQGNRILDSVFDGNAVDVVDVSAAYAPAEGNCVAPADGAVVRPAALAAAGCGTAATAAVAHPGVVAPPGVGFLALPVPPDQPQLAGELTAIPAPLPRVVDHPSTEGIAVPDSTFLADRAGLAEPAW